jgi:hypothetical protein
MISAAVTKSSSSCLLSRFQHLKRVSYRAGQYPPTHPPLTIDISLSLVLPVFYIRHIQTIEMSGVYALSTDDTRSSSPPSATNLTTVIIENSRINEPTLAYLLSFCPSLSTLKYECHLDKQTRPLTPVITGSNLRHALENVRHTLRNLTVSTEVSYPSLMYMFAHLLCGISGPLSLRYFPVLSALEIPFALLFGPHHSSSPPWVNVLPPSLQRLTLTTRGTDDPGPTYGWREIDCARNVLANLKDASTRPAGLKHLTVKLDWFVGTSGAELASLEERITDARMVWEDLQVETGGVAGVSFAVEIMEKGCFEAYSDGPEPILRRLGPYQL